MEVAARRGFGPLSQRGRQVWHGDSRPCVSCGQLVPLESDECPDCGQDLHPEMIERMRAHAGPWYVHEHVRPFPGVTLERLVRQIRRGVLMATTIVRGPTTDHQWRFAAQTPGLSKFLGLCWKCQGNVGESDILCRHCGVDLNGGYRLRPVEPPGPIMPATASQDYVPAPRPAIRERFEPLPRAVDWPRPAVAATPAAPPMSQSNELAALSAAVRPAARQPVRAIENGPARIGGIPAWWIVAGLLLFLFAIMAVIIQQRKAATVRHPEQQTTIPALRSPLPQPENPAQPPPATQESTPAPVIEQTPVEEATPAPEITEPSTDPDSMHDPEDVEGPPPDR